MNKVPSIHFTALLGGANDDGPLCYLLEIDKCRILLDCGWDDQFQTEQLELLEKEINKGIDCVLISHPDLAHLGALPYATGKLGLKAPVYATLPICKMGQMFLYDILLVKVEEENFTTFTLDDVDLIFNRFQNLKYSQRIKLEGFEDINITPYCAGHMIGGTLWKIQIETEEILYAVDYNHKRERHLNSSVLETFQRPSLLITDAFNSLSPSDSRKSRDTLLIKAIKDTLTKGGDILLPVDTAGRVLEILLLLDREWKTLDMENSEIAFLSHTCETTIDFATNQLEWASEYVNRLFEQDRHHPFQFKYIHSLRQLDEVEALRRPRVVLASVASLECGFSRRLFVSWCENPNNLILFTTIEGKNSLARKLVGKAESKKPFEMTLEIKKRIPLEGAELEEYLRKKEEEIQLEKLNKENLEKELENQKKIDGEKEMETSEDSEDESNSESEINNQPEAVIPLGGGNEYFQNGETDLFIQNVKNNSTEIYSNPIFPFKEEINEWDGYGEYVNWDLIKKTMNSMNGSSGSGNDMYGAGYTAGAGNDLDKMLDEEDDNTYTFMEVDEDIQAPTKPIVELVNVVVSCSICFIDFEGRSDGKSIKNIIKRIAPRKIVLIHGQEDACNELFNFCKKELSSECKQVLLPTIGDRVDVTSDTSVFKVTLSESFFKSLQFTMINNHNVAYIDGKIAVSQIENPLPNQPAQKFELVPLDENEPVSGHDAVFLGDVRLNEMKTILTRKGYQVQLNRGVLLCNNLISIQKVSNISGHSRITVEGPLCDEYHQIRELLYQQFCIV